MINWNEIQQQITYAVKTVQKNPFLDSIASSAIKQIPLFGDLLLDIYNNSKDSPEEKTEQILQVLKNMQTMNEENMVSLKVYFEENNLKILANHEFLKQISKNNIDILQKIGDISQDQKKISNTIQSLDEKMNEMKSFIEQNMWKRDSVENKNEQEITTFENDDFKISWPKTWEKISSNVIRLAEQKAAKHLKVATSTPKEKIVKLGIKPILGNDQLVSISVGSEDAEGKNLEEIFKNGLEKLEKGGFQIMDYDIDDYFQTYTIKLQTTSKNILPEFSAVIDIYQYQRCFLKNDRQVLVVITNLSKETLLKIPNADEEIKEIIGSFELK